MSSDKGSQDTDVSGNEAVINQQNKGTKKEINKNIDVKNYSDKKTNSYLESNTEKFKSNNQDSKIKIFNKSNEINRKFYSDKVLTGTNKEKFANLNIKQQEAQYKSYMNDRLSGKSDAYGNVNPNYGKDNSSPTIKTEMQVEQESKTEMEKPKTTEEEEAAYKKRKGLVGSRSLFSTGGQRGFFN